MIYDLKNQFNLLGGRRSLEVVEQRHELDHLRIGLVVLASGLGGLATYLQNWLSVLIECLRSITVSTSVSYEDDDAPGNRSDIRRPQFDSGRGQFFFDFFLVASQFCRISSRSRQFMWSRKRDKAGGMAKSEKTPKIYQYSCQTIR